MRLTVVAVGRLKPGPEATLVADYLARVDAAGRALGLGPTRVVEIDERKRASPEAQAAAILEAIGDAPLAALDERGRVLSSPDFADRLAGWRDGGARDLAFAIGGADGHGPAVRDRAALTLSFGPMVWPHMLARVMLAEQLYRAVSILAGAPYHRA